MKIIFEFSGGSRDGQTDEGDTDNVYGRSDAPRHYWITDNGTIGKRFMIVTPYAMQQLHDGLEGGGGEKYEVTERVEEGDEVLVRAKLIDSA